MVNEKHDKMFYYFIPPFPYAYVFMVTLLGRASETTKSVIITQWTVDTVVVNCI